LIESYRTNSTLENGMSAMIEMLSLLSGMMSGSVVLTILTVP
jgi:hypothetical protein